MKVGLNAASLLSPLTGIGQYTYQLAKGLQKYEDLELDMFYANGWSREVRDRPINRIKTIKFLLRAFIPKTYEVSRLIQQYHFNERSFKRVGGIYHEPNFLAFNYAGPLVLTVHDLSWIRYPETHPVERVKAMNKYFQKSLERASKIITVSEFVKQEVQDVFKIPAERITCVWNGVEPLFRARSDAETLHVLHGFGLQHKKYVLAVGTLEPRKNLENALAAYMLLPEDIRKHYPLVLVGMKGWHTSKLEKQMRPLVSAGLIHVLGYLSREDLATVTAGATTLLYPSIYEGFGLPPLEAMASGVPVITSRVSSLPEVVGDTGLLVDPFDAKDIANALELMLADAAFREAAGKKALARSSQFSWDRCVKETMDIYRQVESNM